MKRTIAISSHARNDLALLATGAFRPLQTFTLDEAFRLEALHA